MTYTEEVYEQLRGDGSVLYKVCAAVPRRWFFGLIKTSDRHWLVVNESTAWLSDEVKQASWFSSYESGLAELRYVMELKSENEKKLKLIHFKRILP